MQLTNNLEFLNGISKQIAKKTTAERQLIFTRWVDQLIDVGAASSRTQAAQKIADDLQGISRQSILNYYQGDK